MHSYVSFYLHLSGFELYKNGIYLCEACAIHLKNNCIFEKYHPCGM